MPGQILRRENIQRDPIGLGGGYNLYSYAGADPLNYTDSTGLIIDTVADFGFIGYGLYRILTDNVLGDCGNLSSNLTALSLDVAGLAIPGVTGLGAASRVANKAVAGKITGYTKHGLNQAIGRNGGKGVKAEYILDAVRNPKKVVE
ncbi:RHS repeat-associated core domain-containing protein [Photobacterium sp. 1_MG-2023]|uniref:RHS repeat-associated core domain-containing protein n=1 Tax=Photobacterium sp. 1_MG-2023 TaxID=3062646 RepID=UPI0026E3F988|nr:RHS repeat-associated core domain-containing protein [Photobacterium sp. 1_MG-2023]MDO6705961.1 RHS repeat-associated core domain-containing protein [Photobacterium sp. 1_MG-2023]